MLVSQDVQTSVADGVNAQHLGNYVNMLGYGHNHDLTEYLRLYIAIHGDHEGGNASAHTARMYLYPLRGTLVFTNNACVRLGRLDPL